MKRGGGEGGGREGRKGGEGGRGEGGGGRERGRGEGGGREGKGGEGGVEGREPLPDLIIIALFIDHVVMCKLSLFLHWGVGIYS